MCADTIHAVCRGGQYPPLHICVCAATIHASAEVLRKAKSGETFYFPPESRVHNLPTAKDNILKADQRLKVMILREGTQKSKYAPCDEQQKHGQVKEASLGNNTVSAAEAGTAPTDVIAPASEMPGRLKIAWCPGPASAQVILSLELQTNLREDFTIMEKAPTRAFSWLKALSSAFAFKTLC